MGKKKGQERRVQHDEEDDGPRNKEQIEAREEKQKQQTNEQKFQPVPPKKVSYCPVCSLPFELCRYGKNPGECVLFLYKLAPTKVTKYHPDFKEEQVEGLKKVQKQTKKVEQQKETKDVLKGGKSVKEKFICIEVKNRGKKNFITTVSGLQNFNVDAKQLAKKCSKKFAVSCSAIEEGTVQLQGDNLQSMRQFLVVQYKLKKKYILDKDQFATKHGQQVAKKKEAKKLEKGAIKQEENEEQEKVEVVKDKNTLRMEAMEKAEQEEEDDD